jgi:hypothetical protein
VSPLNVALICNVRAVGSKIGLARFAASSSRSGHRRPNGISAPLPPLTLYGSPLTDWHHAVCAGKRRMLCICPAEGNAVVVESATK